MLFTSYETIQLFGVDFSGIAIVLMLTFLLCVNDCEMGNRLIRFIISVNAAKLCSEEVMFWFVLLFGSVASASYDAVASGRRGFKVSRQSPDARCGFRQSYC